jgi:hypothetical protein
MIDSHVLNRGPVGVRSHGDRMFGHELARCQIMYGRGIRGSVYFELCVLTWSCDVLSLPEQVDDFRHRLQQLLRLLLHGMKT